MDWKKYEKKLADLAIMEQVNKLDQTNNTRMNIPPENEIGLQHGLITPDSNKNEIINKNLRIGNLNPRDHVKVNVGGMFLSYLEGLTQSKNLQSDKNLILLKEEILQDVNIVQNSSVSKGGWFLQELLSPKKRFQLLPDRNDKKTLERKE